MKNSSDIEQLITQYLLGQTTSNEDEIIEGKYASDPNFLNRVEAVEDDLVDAYVRRQLSPEQNEQFERFFLASPDNRDKVQFARTLITEITPEVERLPAWQPQSLPLIAPIRAWLLRAHLSIQFASIAALTLSVITFGIGWWLLGHRTGERSDQTQQVTENQIQPLSSPKPNQPSVADRAGQMDSPNQRPTFSSRSTPPRKHKEPAVIASFVLTPGLLRGTDEINTIQIPPRAGRIEFRVGTEAVESYDRYRVTLRRIGEREIWRWLINNSSKRQFKFLQVQLPAHLLERGEYLLTVTGIRGAASSEVVGDYSFTVAKR